MVSLPFSAFWQRSAKIVAAVSLVAIVFANLTFVDQVQAQIDCLTRDPSPAEIKAATQDGTLSITMPNANGEVFVTNRTLCALRLAVLVYQVQADGSQRLFSTSGAQRIEGDDTSKRVASAIGSCGTYQVDVFPEDGQLANTTNPATVSQSWWDANVLIGTTVNKGACDGGSAASSSSSSSVTTSGQIPCLTRDPYPAEIKAATENGTLSISMPNANGEVFVTNRTNCALRLAVLVYQVQPDGSQRLYSTSGAQRIEGNDTSKRVASAIGTCGTYQVDVFPEDGQLANTTNPATVSQSWWNANVLIGMTVNKGVCGSSTTSSSSSSSSVTNNGQIPCLTSDPTPAQVKQATQNGQLQITLPNASGVSYVTNRTLCAINLVMPIYKFQPDGSQRLYSISTHRIEGNDTNRQISSPIDSCGGTFQIDVFPKGTIPETIGSNPAEIPQSTWDANVLIGTIVNKGQCTTSVSSSSSSSVSGGSTFLTISKSGPTVAQAGNTVTYSLTVTNNGSVPAVNTYVADVISKSAPVGFIAASSGCAYTPSLDTDLWRVYQCGPFTIQPGQSETRTFTYQINTNASCGSVIDDYGVSSANNASSVVSNPNVPYRTTVQCGTSSSSYSSSSSVQGNTSLSIVKSGPTYANAGNSVTYSLRVTNNGSVPAVNTFVADVISKTAPVDFNYVSLNGGCAYTPHLDTNLWRVYQCGPFTLQPGQSETRTFTYQITSYASCGSFIEDYGVTSANNAGSAVSNPNLPYRTNIQCGSSSSSYSSYSSSSYSSSSGNGDVSISKSDDRSTASVGDRLNYRITVRNLNSFTLTNVRVTDSLPSTLKFLSATYPGELKGHSVRWDLTLAPYEVRELRVEAEVKSNAAGRSIRNIVRAKGERAEDTTSIDNNRYVDRRTNPYQGDAITSVNVTEIEDYPTQQVYTVTTMPRTGANDRTGPLENTRKFLFPGSGNNGSMPMIIWMSILSLGAAAGGIIGKRYFL